MCASGAVLLTRVCRRGRQFACVFVCVCGVNATCELVSILAVSILWREALEHKSTCSLIMDVEKSPRSESRLPPLA